MARTDRNLLWHSVLPSHHDMYGLLQKISLVLSTKFTSKYTQPVVLFFDVLALTEIALINISCIFCQHLSLLFIAKFSINSCLHFLIQERGPKVTYEINMPRARIFVDCTDDSDDEHCRPNRRPPTNTEVYVLPSFPLFYYVPYANCVVHVSVMHT
jgi:hypothetical protein